MLLQGILDLIYQKTGVTPTIMKNSDYIFSLNPYTRTFINEKGQQIYLTSKEFDVLHFLYSHKGQVFTKE